MRDLVGDWLPRWAGFVIAFALVTYLSRRLRRAGAEGADARPRGDAGRAGRAAGRADGEGAAAGRLGPAGLGGAAAAAVRGHRGDGGRVDAHRRRAARAGRRGRGLGRDPARAGGAAAQRLRLRRPRGARRDGALARRGLARGVADRRARRWRSWSRPRTQRYPVGDESLDHLVGIVHFRDLLASPRRDRRLARAPGAGGADDQGPRRAAARAARGSASRWRSSSTSTAARPGS